MTPRVIHSYTTTNIVILCDGGALRIYAEDFSHDTEVDLPGFVTYHLHQEHIRLFESMREFTEWLHEVGAIVDGCVCS